jgi:hypothetical protein
MRRRTFLVAIPLTFVGVAALVGPAIGRWSPGASTGAGAGLVGTAALVTMSAAATTAVLYPTGTATGDVSLRLTNPNSFSVHIPRLALDTSSATGGFAVDASHSACPLSSLTYTTQTNGGSGWTVPAAGSLALDLGNAISLSTAAPAACQGASFTVYLTT